MAASSRDQLFGYVPITTEWFEDELRIVKTSSEYQGTLGAKILSVEGTDLAELKKQLLTVVPHANYQRFEKLSPSYLQLPGLLYGLGATSSPDQARFSLQLQSGEKQEVVFQRMNDEQYKDATFVTTDQMATSLPLYRQRKDESYWYEYLPDEKLFYFRYNRITSDDEKPIWSWAPQMWAQVDSLDVEKLVIDIRGNGGGGFQFSLPIIQGILDRPNLNQRGKLFVSTDNKTFSAAIGFLEQLENRSNAMIVGVPPCDYPASPGDGDSFLLGDTGIKINLSQIFHATIFPDDQRVSIGMDQLIPTSWEDYAAGKDRLLQFVKEFQAKETAETSVKAFAWVGRYAFSSDKVLTISKVDSGLVLKIGKFFSTPLYSSTAGRFKTEIVGMEVGLTDTDQVRLFYPDGKKRSYQRCMSDHPTPLELLYNGKFEEAQAAYQAIVESDPKGKIVSDGALADTALLLYWDLVKEKGRTEAKKYARKTLEIAIELFPEAPMSKYSLRFYR
jgi:hypothetical protein